jgi:hypothetical protein
MHRLQDQEKKQCNKHMEEEEWLTTKGGSCLEEGAALFSGDTDGILALHVPGEPVIPYPSQPNKSTYPNAGTSLA